VFYWLLAVIAVGLIFNLISNIFNESNCGFQSIRGITVFLLSISPLIFVLISIIIAQTFSLFIKDKENNQD
jgi:nitrogen fixation/metabolism regulation signal transduction histidine kinase